MCATPAKMQETFGCLAGLIIMITKIIIIITIKNIIAIDYC